VFDPCYSSSGMFVQSLNFIDAHKTGHGNGGEAKASTSVYGQESNHSTWRLAKMNLAIRGIDDNLGKLTSRLAPGPPGRLRPDQSPVQRLRLAGRADGRRQAQPGLPRHARGQTGKEDRLT